MANSNTPAESDTPVATSPNMFAAVMMPSAVPMGPASPDRLPSMPSMQMSSFASSPFRPSRPSPLSSSPIRASPSPPHSSQMDTQSSPIHSSQSSIFNFSADAFNSNNSNNKLFKYASRPVKQVARGQQTRDAAQQTRRSLFLRNVRQRADDRGWERRNFEQELQRMEYFSSEEEFRRAREAEAAELFAGHNLDEEIEESLQWANLSQSPSQNQMDDGMTDSDEHIADLLAMEEEAEMERLLALEQEQAQAQQDAMLPQQPSQSEHQLSRQPSAHFYSDDSEYDDIFAELASADEDMDMDL